MKNIFKSYGIFKYMHSIYKDIDGEIKWAIVNTKKKKFLLKGCH